MVNLYLSPSNAEVNNVRRRIAIVPYVALERCLIKDTDSVLCWT